MNTTTNRARRDFLRISAAGAGVMALGALGKDSPFVAPARALPLTNHKRLVIINMLGGNDGLNTVFPVTGALGAEYMNRRPTIGYAQGTGLSLAGGPGVPDYEINPALVNLQTMWNAGEVAILPKVGYPSANLSHFVSEDIWSWGARYGLASLPGMAPGWIARYANTNAPTSLGVVSIGVGRRLDFEGANANPMMVSSLTAFNFLNDSNYTANHVLRRQKVREMLTLQGTGNPKAAAVAAAQLAAIDGSAAVQASITDYNTYAAGAGITYPNTAMGNRLRDVARLVYGGFETRIFYTGYGGFDTHSAQRAAHFNLLAQLDNALNVFRNDMINMGVWQDTVVVVISEFGRRNFENGSVGTDHGHGNMVITVGGPVKGGLVGGLLASEIAMDYLPYQVDFRDIYRELVGDHLGHTTLGLFPETQPVNLVPDLV